jgi:hypothetical protein
MIVYAPQIGSPRSMPVTIRADDPAPYPVGRIASRGMLLDKFSPMTGETSPNRFGVVNGETNQHGRTA